MKPIKITDTQKQAALANFQKFLDTTKSLEDNVSFKVDLGAVLGTPLTPTICITACAYVKLRSLVNNSPAEVAWHGTVTHIPPNTYIITDIVVYPQVVSGVSVDTDQTEYELWLHALDDVTFNSLRMQGHSHVNMGATPSGADWTLYDKMLQGMTRIPYYIFMVTNKRNEIFLMLYDFNQNICFETKDCDWNVLLDDEDFLDTWLTNTLKNVRQTKETPVVTYEAYTYDSDEVWEKQLAAYNKRIYNSKGVK